MTMLQRTLVWPSLAFWGVLRARAAATCCLPRSQPRFTAKAVFITRGCAILAITNFTRPSRSKVRRSNTFSHRLCPTSARRLAAGFLLQSHRRCGLARRKSRRAAGRSAGSVPRLSAAEHCLRIMARVDGEFFHARGPTTELRDQQRINSARRRLRQSARRATRTSDAHRRRSAAWSRRPRARPAPASRPWPLVKPPSGRAADWPPAA